VPILGLAHGLPFSAFPSSYLAAAEIAQAILLGGLWLAAGKLPASWQRPAAGVLLIAGIGWFARMLL
jgi:hypothetical protein